MRHLPPAPTTKPTDVALTLYTTSWCPFCARLTSDLAAQGLEWTEIDVDHSAEAAELVTKINHGNRVVPTVVFEDGTTMTNPPAANVLAKVRESN